MSRLDRFEDWLDDHMLVVSAVLIALLLILFALLIVACIVDSGHNDAWGGYADQMNKNTDYYLDNETYGSCGYVKTIGSDYSVTISVSPGYNGSVDYCKVHTNDRGIVLEWYKKSAGGSVTLTSTTYIPYESICYVQANKVV